MRSILLLVCAVMLLACPPTPVNPPPDAQDGSSIVVVDRDAGAVDAAPLTVDAGDVVDRACAVLRAVGCPSGAILVDGGDGCEAVMRLSMQPGGFDMKPACIAAQTTKEGVIACGTVKCTVATGTRVPVRDR